jgi:hypothetical protein
VKRSAGLNVPERRKWLETAGQEDRDAIACHSDLIATFLKHKRSTIEIGFGNCRALSPE